MGRGWGAAFLLLEALELPRFFPEVDFFCDEEEMCIRDRCMCLRGAKVLFVPAAFNMTTGPAHWELLLQIGRAHV